jgi:hypothetical protein
MKSILKTVFMNIAVLLLISSCSNLANITEGPEGKSFSVRSKEPNESELRLLSVDILQSGSPSADVAYWSTINFEADHKPEISRACFKFSGDGQSCVDVEAKDVRYGVAHPYFRVPIHIPAGSKRIDCYAEYIRDGKTRRTNIVTYYVIVLKKPEE